MAGIDKTYVTKEQFTEVINWANGKSFECYSGKVNVSDFIYDEPDWDYINENFSDNPTTVLWNTPTYFDVWLIRNCPLDFIQDRLKEQYGSSYDDIKNGTSEYDIFKRNGRGEDIRFNIIRKPDFHNRGWFHPRSGRKMGMYHYWYIGITGPDGESLWYNQYTDMFYFPDELASWTSNAADVSGVMTPRKIYRLLRKWNLPTGCTVTIGGKYIGEKWIVKTK